MARRNFRRATRPALARLRANRQFRDSDPDPACAICGHKVHLHAHHMRQACDGGDESPSNKVLLCPNHHAMADRVSHRNKHIRSREEMVRLIREYEARAGG